MAGDSERSTSEKIASFIKEKALVVGTIALVIGLFVPAVSYVALEVAAGASCQTWIHFDVMSNFVGKYYYLAV